MSHHHYDKESEMVGTINVENNTISHRHSHNHINLKPTTVLDHLRTKVKRKSKRISQENISEIPAFAINNNNNIPQQQTSQDHNELEINTTSPTRQSQPSFLKHVASDQSFEHNNKENHLPKEKHELERDEDIIESIPFPTSPTEPDIDNNKNTKSKFKLNKSTKSSSDLQINTKKRRQTARRTVQCSSDIQRNKKTKRNDMEKLPYSAGFQIRDEDFHSIFNDLPSDEQLIVAYPCAWRKDIFMHGRMFLSVNYLCFYTCFFKWEESLCIAYKDITSVKRVKPGKLLPNAIQLRTNNREQYIFASYVPRERIFIAIFRLWHNILLEKPLDYQQLRTIVFADHASIDESSGDSEESIVLENNTERLSKDSSQVQSLPLIPLGTSIDSAPSFIKPDERIISALEPKCPCESHLTRTYADQVFPYHVEKLFELIYGDNSFTRTYHESEKLIDYVIREWHKHPETGKRERLVTYKTVIPSFFGNNTTITCNEKQFVDVEKPHSMYVLNTEVSNEGMKYADTFIVATRFCMSQRDAKNSSLRITAEVRYVKSVNGIVKTFIERSCYSSIESGVNNLIRRLEDHQAVVHNQKHTSKNRLHKKKDRDINSDENNKLDSSLNNHVSSNDQRLTITGNGFLFDTVFFVGIFLLILHIFLCYKLFFIDQALFNIDQMCLNDCRKVCLSNK